MKEAIGGGVDGFDSEIRKSVRKAAYGLRLTREVAMSIASKAVSIKSIHTIIGLHKIIITPLIITFLENSSGFFV